MKTTDKDLRTQPFQISISVILIAAIAFLGTPSSGWAQVTSGTDFTGEEIFRGLFFGEAPVSQLFPEIWATPQAAESLDTKEKVIAWSDLKISVVQEIVSNDATFMDRFGQQMQSGDHLSIQAALAEASQVTFAALQSLGYMDSAGSPSGDPNLGLWVFVAGAVVVAAAVAAVAVGVVVVAGWSIIVVYQIRFYPPRPGEIPTLTESSLYQEMLIDSMAQRLSGS